MVKIVLFVLGLVALGQASISHPNFCGRSLLAGGIEDVRFGPCVEQPCNVYPGKEFVFEVDFLASSAYFINVDLDISIMGITSEGLKSLDIAPQVLPLPTNYDARGAIFPLLPYTVKYSIKLPLEFEFEHFILKAELFGLKRNTKQQEFCVHIDVNNQILF